MSSVNIRSTEALSDLQKDLVRFGADCHNFLQGLDMELRRTLEWVAERKRFWQGQVRRLEAEVRQTRAELERCRSGNDREADCNAIEVEWRRATAHLREAQGQLANVSQWMRTLEEARISYQRQFRNMTAFTEKELLEAQMFLKQRVASLDGYATISSTGSVSTSASTNVPPSTINSAQKGADFEAWAEINVFGQKKRISIPVLLNQHLAKKSEDGLVLKRNRISDNYVDDDGSLWDTKAYSDNSRIDRDQLQDYSLMERAGYVFDSTGTKIPVTSVNYLFSSRTAAEKNSVYLYGMANIWYVAWQSDGSGSVQLLEE